MSHHFVHSNVESSLDDDFKIYNNDILLSLLFSSLAFYMDIRSVGLTKKLYDYK